MTISDRIFDLLKDRGMSQKEFSDSTGIAQGAISDWKRKHTNPSADNILIISKVLDVDPAVLLSGNHSENKRSKASDLMVIDTKTDEGFLLETFLNMGSDEKKRLLEYVRRITDSIS